MKIAEKNLVKAELKISDLQDVISDNNFSSFMLNKIKNFVDDEEGYYRDSGTINGDTICYDNYPYLCFILSDMKFENGKEISK